MSNRESDGIINKIPDEIEPDEIDLKMISDAEKINDGKTITLEKLAKDLNLTR
jgi:hypothetical protein